jgi:hypothetical protein
MHALRIFRWYASAILACLLAIPIFAQSTTTIIATQPANGGGPVGGSASFSFSVSVPIASANLSIAAFDNGSPLPSSRFSIPSQSVSNVGSNNGTITLGYFTVQINNLTAADAGPVYFLIYVNGGGLSYNGVPLTNTTQPVSLSVGPLAAPVITTQPQSQSVAATSSVTFSVVASGIPAPTYQWQLNGSPISGATGTSFTLQQASFGLGSYTVVVTNSLGSATSNPAVLTLLGAPVITSQPFGATVSSGQSVTLTVTASNATTYQWYLNGAAVAGAMGATLVIPSVTAATTGAYTVVVGNGAGSVTSSPATVALVASARLINLSARASVGTGGNALIVGFVVGGSGTKQLLLRADGPSLTALGVAGALSNPSLSLAASPSGSVLATNTVWGGTTALTAAFTQVGAFAWASTSADSALLYPLGTGNYTASVTGVGTGSLTGVALAEIYDADTGTPTGRLTNLSSRANVGTGANILIAGFVIGGTGSERVLIRGTGPALANYGLSAASVLSTPQLTLSDSSGKVIATNLNGWSNPPVLGPAPVAASASVQSASAAVMAGVGAFPLTPGAADTAMLVTLPAGAYTAQVAGANNSTGISLIEVYEAP